MTTAQKPMGNVAYRRAYEPLMIELASEVLGHSKPDSVGRVGDTDYVAFGADRTIFRVRRPAVEDKHYSEFTLRWKPTGRGKDEDPEVIRILNGFGEFMLYAYGHPDTQPARMPEKWVLLDLEALRRWVRPQTAAGKVLGKDVGKEGRRMDANDLPQFISFDYGKIPGIVVRARGLWTGAQESFDF